MRDSLTWQSMTEEQRDVARSRLRKAAGQFQAIRATAPPSQRRVFDAIEALMMDDRTILGGCLVMLLGIDACDLEDKAHYFLTQICHEIEDEGIDGCTGPGMEIEMP